MNANELRIGNFVMRFDLFDNNERIETVIALGKQVLTTGPITVSCEYSEIYPIPLDETFSHFAEVETDVFGDCFIYAEKQYNTRFYFSRGRLIYCKGHCTPISTYEHIEHVHQFQNLFHANVGREVKTNPLS